MQQENSPIYRGLFVYKISKNGKNIKGAIINKS